MSFKIEASFVGTEYVTQKFYGTKDCGATFPLCCEKLGAGACLSHELGSMLGTVILVKGVLSLPHGFDCVIFGLSPTILQLVLGFPTKKFYYLLLGHCNYGEGGSSFPISFFVGICLIWGLLRYRHFFFNFLFTECFL